MEASAQKALTQPDGSFSIAVAPGKFRIVISKEGFLEWSRTIEVRDELTIPDVTLEIAPVRESIEVNERAGYDLQASRSATKTATLLRDVPQSVSVVTAGQMHDQLMTSIGDVVRYVPGITATQGENNRDQLVIRGNSTSADFFLDGVRDDVQYYRDVYNLDRMEALKGPNALIFGRGGAGGVVNRVSKEAGFMPEGELTFEGGMYGDARGTIDVDRAVNQRLALRLNAMGEQSGSFRDHVGLGRYGINPTATIAAGERTRITVDDEHFHDGRTADRGIPSFQGLPLDVPVDTYFGNPDASRVFADVDLGSVLIEHQAGAVNIRNRTLVGNYDRGYQNFVPGAVTADGMQDSVSGYNNATCRRNLLNQTDVTYSAHTGRVKHTFLAGAELGRQLTNNFRNTAYFNNSSTTLLVPLTATVFSTPATIRQSATDADNHLETNLAAAYVQDQMELSRHVQFVAGVRFDYFDLQYHDHRTGTNLRRIDHLVSPRAGLIYKPATAVSLYASYSVSYLPSSGDQFSSLTIITQQAKPEQFTNYEIGAKWDATRRLSLTTAVFRLDRTNTRATDPNDATRLIQTGGQRTNGFEAGITGELTRAWRISGGYSYMDAFVVSATTSAKTGAQVAQAPHNTFSLWNNYQVLRRLGAGVGIVNRSGMFAAIDDSVVLPGYTRVDAALFYSLSERIRLQANVENLLDKKYYLNADNNTNISPGAPVAFRVGLIARF